MAPRKKTKLTACVAKRRLIDSGIDFEDDFHILSSGDKALVLSHARAARYRKRKDAPGSTARMYFQYLARKKGC